MDILNQQIKALYKRKYKQSGNPSVIEDNTKITVNLQFEVDQWLIWQFETENIIGAVADLPPGPPSRR